MLLIWKIVKSYVKQQVAKNEIGDSPPSAAKRGHKKLFAHDGSMYGSDSESSSLSDPNKENLEKGICRSGLTVVAVKSLSTGMYIII